MLEDVVTKNIIRLSKQRTPWAAIGIVLAFALGNLSPLGVAYLQGDVDTRVWNQTQEHRQKISATLIDLIDKEEKLMLEKRATEAMRSELAAQKVDYRELETKTTAEIAECSALLAAQKRRPKKPTSGGAPAPGERDRAERIAPYIGYVCRFNPAQSDVSRRQPGLVAVRGGYRVVFAPGTPDEKVFTSGVERTCKAMPDSVEEDQCRFDLASSALNTLRTENQRCEEHLDAVLAAKGLSETDIFELKMRQLGL